MGSPCLTCICVLIVFLMIVKKTIKMVTSKVQLKLKKSLNCVNTCNLKKKLSLFYSFLKLHLNYADQNLGNFVSQK